MTAPHTPIPLPASALIVGATGGLGAALVTEVGARGFETFTSSRRGGAGRFRIDVTNEPSIVSACTSLSDARSNSPALRLVIVATGLLHDATMRPEKSMRSLDAETLTRSFAVNAIGPALVAKHVLPLLPRDGKCVFAVLSARVGSISDNSLGGWYGYRASKAALNQIVRTLAIETKRSCPDAILVALHPGTVDTTLSAPFRKNIGRGKVFTPGEAAGRLLGVINALTPQDSGKLIGWDGNQISY